MNKSDLEVVVYIRDYKETDSSEDNFNIKLPCRPMVGDWINVNNQELIWNGEKKELFSAHLNKAKLLASSGVRVEDVVFVVDTESEKTDVVVFGRLAVDPVAGGG